MLVLKIMLRCVVVNVVWSNLFGFVNVFLVRVYLQQINPLSTPLIPTQSVNNSLSVYKQIFMIVLTTGWTEMHNSKDMQFMNHPVLHTSTI